MKKIIKNILIFLGLHKPLMEIVNNYKNKKIHQKIQRKNENSILEYKKYFGCNIFIETGTYKGEMVEAMKNHFKKIYSIEVGNELYKKATEKFSQDKHIEIILGDSSIVLAEVLSKIDEPVLFWLDAHDSGGDTARGSKITPIEKELEIIFNHHIKNHVILIDDARDFTGRGGYPSAETIENLARNHNYLFELKNDNFRIYPKTI